MPRISDKQFGFSLQDAIIEICINRILNNCANTEVIPSNKNIGDKPNELFLLTILTYWGIKVAKIPTMIIIDAQSFIFLTVTISDYADSNALIETVIVVFYRQSTFSKYK